MTRLLKYQRKSGNASSIAICLSDIGQAHLNLFQFNESLDVCTQALAIFPASDKINIALCCMNGAEPT